jgi:hypothetical protein
MKKYFVGLILASLVFLPLAQASYFQKPAGVTTEVDPIYSASPASNSTLISQWNTAYAYGNHAAMGYLTSEVDGSTTNELQNLFGVITSDSGSVSASSTNTTLQVTGSGIISTSIVGNNLIIEGTIGGNATSFFGVVNTDSTSVVAPAVNSTLVLEGRGITSVYADGNYTDRVVIESIETDPIYSGDPAFGITAGDITNWNIAYAFGNHATQNYAHTTGNTFTGVHDFGGATSIEIVNGANPTVDALGEIAVDSTANQLLFYGNATITLSAERSLSVTIPSLANTDDNFLFWIAPTNLTITKVGCKYCGAGITPATIALEDDAGNTMTHGTVTCVNQGTAVTFIDVTAANGLITGEGLRFDTTNTPNPATDNYTIVAVYTVDRQ